MIFMSTINYLISVMIYLLIEISLFHHDTRIHLTNSLILERTIIFTLLYFIVVILIGQIASPTSTFRFYLERKKEEKHKKTKNTSTPKTKNWIKNSGQTPNIDCSILVLLRDGNIKHAKAVEFDWSLNFINADIIEWYPEYAIFSHSGKSWVKNYGYKPPCTGMVCLRLIDNTITKNNVENIKWDDKNIIEWTI